MRSPLDDPEMEALAARMGMGKAALATLLGIPRKEAEEKLAAMKAKLKACFRDIAFEVHPDRNPDDPLAADRFKALAAMREYLEGLAIGPGRRPGDAPPMKSYAEREREWVERAREERRRARARAAGIHVPTEEETRSYGTPEDTPRRDPEEERRAQKAAGVTLGSRFRYGVGIRFATNFYTDPI